MKHENKDITKVNTTKLRVFEAFAGMGAQRKALENINLEFEVVGMGEWFVPAIVTYQTIHNNFAKSQINKKIPIDKIISYLSSKTLSMDSKNPVSDGYWSRKRNSKDLRLIYTAVKMSEEEGNIFDIRTLAKRKLEDVDLLTYSFPCQDLSQQGLKRGMSKETGTRSGLLWEIEKALDATPKNKLPKYLLMENVMALTFKTNKSDLNKWMSKLESLGYKNDISVLNSADFGSPQARRRAFMISSLSKHINLPKGDKAPKTMNNIINKTERSKDILKKLDKYKKEEFKITKSNIRKTRLINYTTFNSEAYVYDPNYTGPTLTASGANSRIKFMHKNQIRKMNPEEAFRYMGFTTSDYKKIKKLDFLTDNKMIYTCGNSIVVQVLESIFKEIKNEI